MTDAHNGGTLFAYIERQNLNLADHVPCKYRELVLDVAIQIVNGVSAAHS